MAPRRPGRRRWRNGWDRTTRIDGTQGARILTGHGVLAHNLVEIWALAA
jgi:IS5 family transposase